MRTARKISGGSQKYRKGVDHRKGGRARKAGLQSAAELCNRTHKLGRFIDSSWRKGQEP